MEDMEKEPHSPIQRNNYFSSKQIKSATSQKEESDLEQYDGSKSCSVSSIKDFESDNEKDIEPQELIYTTRDYDEVEQNRLKNLETETRCITEELKKEIAEKDKIILAQALKQAQIQKDFQEQLAKETQNLIEKVVDITKNMNANHIEEINKVVGNLCNRFETINQQRQQQDIKKENLSPKEEKKNNFVNLTFSKFKEILQNSQEKDRLKSMETDVIHKYEAKIKELNNLDFKSRKQQKDEIEIWFKNQQEQIKILRKRSISQALKQTANIIEENNESNVILGFEEKGVDKFNIEKTGYEDKNNEEIVSTDMQYPTNISIKNLVQTADIPQEVNTPTEGKTTDPEARSSSEIDWLISLDGSSNQIRERNFVKEKHEELHIENNSDDNRYKDAELKKENALACPTKLEDEKFERKLDPIKGGRTPSEPSEDPRCNSITDSIIDMFLQEVKEHLFPKRPISIKPSEIVSKDKISGINTSIYYIESYVSEVFQEVLKDPENFVASLSIPLNRDPLFILGQIQNEDQEYFDTIEQTLTQSVLSTDLYLEIERSHKINTLDNKPKNKQHDELLTEWSNVHNKCIFDAINDALDYYRPYSIKGPPLPWSKQLRELTYKNGSVESILDVLWGVKGKVLTWAISNGGTLNIPLELCFENLGQEKSKLDQYREERLEIILAAEVKKLSYLILGK